MSLPSTTNAARASNVGVDGPRRHHCARMRSMQISDIGDRPWNRLAEPHCGVFKRSAPLKGKRDRIGLYKCYACRKPFTVKIGTIFEDSHIAMRDWLTAIHLICSSKKGISANQLHRTLGITLKSAWFLGHRIREAMRSGELAPMGGAGGIVEADETFIGRKDGSI